MNELSTIRDLFSYDDWAMQKVFAAAETLSDTQFDRAFEMGFNTLRATIKHILFAKQIWLARCVEGPSATFSPVEESPSLATFRSLWAENHAAWNVFVDRNIGRLNGTFDYRLRNGEARSSRLLSIELHVCNHGMCHRAQAINMLRHLGVKPPRLDYIFRYHESESKVAPALSIELIREYLRYTDWARDRVLAACTGLTDEQLDRPFEMGLGTIRATLLHTEDGERWWLRNWRNESPGAFPKPDPAVSIAALQERFNETAAARNRFIDALPSDNDLVRQIETRPMPDRVFSFPLAVTMVQMGNHGTHHRAQVVNMLRHVGVTAPGTDLCLMSWEK